MRKIVLSLGILCALVVVAALALQWELENPYYAGQAAEVYIDIPRHANTSQIADTLVESGVLRFRLPFLIYVRLKNLGRHIQAGEYRFAEPASPIDIAGRLAKGDVTFRSVTIPEGLTAQETVELLVKHGIGSAEEFQPLLSRTDWVRDIDPKAQSLEGYLFPETYRFSRKVDCETVLKTMVQQFRDRMAKLTEQYPASPGWTTRRLVILASMIQEEVKRADEAPLVASVLVNRINKGMPLAVDATIIYAMKLAGTYEGRLGKADLVMESPYNTYIHTSMPPGPIANPGEISLRAALRPAQTDYYYYVSRNDGTHKFSEDYASHQNAVNRFQKSLNVRRK